jgi:hypothetical protein
MRNFSPTENGQSNAPRGGEKIAIILPHNAKSLSLINNSTLLCTDFIHAKKKKIVIAFKIPLTDTFRFIF